MPDSPANGTRRNHMKHLRHNFCTTPKKAARKMFSARRKTRGVSKTRAAAAPPDPQVGSLMSDGTIYAGLSPDTKSPMFVTPADAPLPPEQGEPIYTFDEAQKYARRLRTHGRKDWRVPTRRELKMLFNNRA